MDRGKELKILEDANKIQADLADAIKKHNKMTSRQNSVMIFLSIVIAFLTIVLVIYSYFALLTNCNKTRRYAISGGKGGVYVLDTKTSQLWQRTASPTKNLYFGTNETPKEILIESKDEQQQ